MSAIQQMLVASGVRVTVTQNFTLTQGIITLANTPNAGDTTYYYGLGTPLGIGSIAPNGYNGYLIKYVLAKKIVYADTSQSHDFRLCLSATPLSQGYITQMVVNGTTYLVSNVSTFIFGNDNYWIWSGLGGDALNGSGDVAVSITG